MKIFCGKRVNNTDRIEVYCNGRPLSPARSLKIRNHSADGFNWGYGGSGPAQLALALLLSVYGKEVAHRWYQHFKFGVISRLPNEWVLTEGDIRNWYENALPPNGKATEQRSAEASEVERPRIPDNAAHEQGDDDDQA